MDEKVKAIVETNSGKIEGRYQDGLYVFKGIPYAAAPVGKRRWQAPAPVEPWGGVRKANEFGKVAPQIAPPPGILDALSVPEPQGRGLSLPQCLESGTRPWRKARPRLDSRRRLHYGLGLAAVL